MDRPISLLMDKHVTTVDFNDSIANVEKIMNSRRLSFVVVLDSNGNCFGVISYTDILRFHVQNKNPKTERAWELCTHKVIEVTSDSSARDAAKLMIKNRIHHIVVTENQFIVGIVSSNDFVKEYLKQNP
jgi:signal-transduction protein with cAMP-binding, CBS, and nucleotidyltransferase domain